VLDGDPALLGERLDTGRSVPRVAVKQVKSHHRVPVILETTAPLRRTRLAMKRTLAQQQDRAS
jgi:hypothetical protein